MKPDLTRRDERVFEYICDRVIPGCTHKERGDTRERVVEKARQHLHEHHGLEYLDEVQTARLTAAVLSVR